jgi:multidrug resistance efflux pump
MKRIAATKSVLEMTSAKIADMLKRISSRIGRAVRWFFGLRSSFRFWLIVLVLVILALVAYFVGADRSTPLTTDAYVQAYVVQIAPQVGGQVTRIHVAEGDQVHAGDLLFELDPRPFEHQVALLRAKHVEAQYEIKQLEAQLAAAQARQRQFIAEADYARAVHAQETAIYQKQSTTERKYLDSVQNLKASEAAVERSASEVKNIEEKLAARVGDEHASVAQAKASLDDAELNLSYCQVDVPCDGVITNLQLAVGTYAHVGQAVMTCIDTRSAVIVANFRERSLERLRVGQPALVAFQSVPGQLWPATVRNIGTGVAQGQGVPTGMLPLVENQTFWIPPAQRFQVRLVLDDPQEVPMRVGMTASVSVYTESSGFLGAITRALHHIVSWLYYL